MTKPASRFPTARARRQRRFIGIAVLALLVLLVIWRVTAPSPSVPPEPVVATLAPAPTPPVPAPAPAPPAPATPAPEPAAPVDAIPPAAAPAAPAPAETAAQVAAAPALPPLTSVVVAPRAINEVPEEKMAPRPDSTALDMTRPPPGYAGRHPSEGSTTGPPKQFSGAARINGPTSLTVGAIPVQLFGVKPPLPGDRCELGGTPMSCTDLAKKRLLERFGRSDQVNCRTPNPQPGLVVAFAICLDANGIDLGSFLLNEGLALADTGQSYDYVGAEGVARTLKHGLWKFR
jgi:endonuclease YncB( thermonuclease family)